MNGMIFSISVFLVFCVAGSAFAIDEKADPNAYQPGLLEEDEKRGILAREEGLHEEQYNPDPEGLMEAKEKQRISDMGYEREHEFDFEKYEGHDGDWDYGY